MKKYCSLLILFIFLLGFTALVSASDILPTPEDSIFPFDKQIEINVLIKKPNETIVDYNEMPIIKELEEKTNIKLDFEAIPENMWNEKVSIKFAAGSIPDMVIGGLPGNLLSQYADYGVIPPLEDLIKENCPNITAIFAENPEYKAYMTSLDGHIYSLGNIQPNPIMYVHDRFYINTDWLDKLGLEMPETTEEFARVLKAFKEQDPNGNGRADEIPFSFVGVTTNGGWAKNLDSFFGAFGVLDNQDNHIMIKDGKVVFAPQTEGYREGIKYLHNLYEDGLIDMEVYTHDVNQYHAKGHEDPTVIGSFIHFKRDFMVGEDKKYNYDYLPALKGPDGEQYWIDRGASVGNGLYVITVENKYIVETLKLIDYMLSTDEIMMDFQWGPEGWKWVEEGKKWQQAVSVGDQTVEEYRFNNALANRSIYMHEKDWYGNMKVMGETETFMLNGTRLYQKYFPQESYNNIKLNTEEQKEIGQLETLIFEYVDQMEARWILAGGVDKEWDSYINKLKDMGVERLVEIRQRSYDRFLDSKN